MKVQRVYLNSVVWEQLRRVVLGEARKYRGETDIRLQDLQKLVDAIATKTTMIDAQLNGAVDSLKRVEAVLGREIKRQQ